MINIILSHHRSTSCLTVIFLTMLLGGCATAQQRPVLDFGVGIEEAAKNHTWPQSAAPTSAQSDEKPRFRYLGQLTGESNFRAPTETSLNIRRVFRVLFEFVFGESDPVVLQRPQSGVVDKTGRILITDTSRQAVYVFDPQEGRLDIWEIAFGLTHFISPAGITSDETGEIYVADAELGLVVRLDHNGNNISTIGKGELKRPVGLAFDAIKRELYVADTRAHSIKVFNPEGHLLRTLGKHGEAAGELNSPTYIALAKGELFVTDTMNARVQVLDALTGNTKLVIGERGLNVGNLVRPKGISVDSEGNIYVVESYYDHLLVYNKHGEFLLPIGGTGQNIGQFYLPAGLWIDAKDRVFVADMFNGRITLFQYLGGNSNNEKK